MRHDSSESESYNDSSHESGNAEASVSEDERIIRVDKGLVRVDNNYCEVELLSDMLHMQLSELKDAIRDAENLCGRQKKRAINSEE